MYLKALLATLLEAARGIAHHDIPENNYRRGFDRR
jgi:hypothetical protein